MIENFLDFVETYGFLRKWRMHILIIFRTFTNWLYIEFPANGARIYYLNRSQPPFLTRMVKRYLEFVEDDELLQRALPILDTEYEFWMKNTTVEIVDPKNDEKHYLNRYNVEYPYPRPEAYYEDWHTARLDMNMTEQDRINLYSDLATGAETGWDYSSRWLRNKEYEGYTQFELLKSLNTRAVIPVELNSLLYDMEIQLANWNNGTKQAYYESRAEQRLHSMDALLWNDEKFSFYDFNLTSQSQQIEFTASNYFPFWWVTEVCKCKSESGANKVTFRLGAVPERLANDSEKLSKVFSELKDILQLYPGILTTTLVETGLQWDLPNGWVIVWIYVLSYNSLPLLITFSIRFSHHFNTLLSMPCRMYMSGLPKMDIPKI